MDLWPFLKAIFEYWWALMSCAAFTLLGLYVLAAKKSNKWALSATFGAAGLMLLVASFLAWQEQYRASIAAEAAFLSEKQSMLPKLNARIERVMSMTTARGAE